MAKSTKLNQQLKVPINPFILAQLLGQGVTTFDGRQGGFFCVAYNVAYLIVNLFGYVMHVYTMENKCNYNGYTFISYITFYVHVYIMPLHMCLLTSINLLIQKNIYKNFSSMMDIVTEFAKAKIEFKSRLHKVVMVFATLLALIIACLVTDVAVNGHNFSVLFWIYVYLPSMAATNSILLLIGSMDSCTNRFISINNFLKKFLDSNILTTMHSTEARVKIKRLTEQIPGEQNTIFDKVFEQYSRTFQVTEKLNRFCGYPLLLFMALTLALILSCSYNFFKDCVMLLKGKPIMERTFYACDFLTVLYATILVILIKACVELTENGNYTKCLLQTLVSLYPELQQSGKVYSLQLLHEKVQLTAAGYLKLNTSIILEILAGMVTYLIILVQLSE